MTPSFSMLLHAFFEKYKKQICLALLGNFTRTLETWIVHPAKFPNSAKKRSLVVFSYTSAKN